MKGFVTGLWSGWLTLVALFACSVAAVGQSMPGIIQENLPDPDWKGTTNDTQILWAASTDPPQYPAVSSKAEITVWKRNATAVYVDIPGLKDKKIHLKLRASRKSPYSFMYMYGLPGKKKDEASSNYKINKILLSADNDTKHRVGFPCLFYARTVRPLHPLPVGSVDEKPAFVQLLTWYTEARLTFPDGSNTGWQTLVDFDVYRVDKPGSHFPSYPAGLPNSAEATPLIFPVETDSFLQGKSVAFLDIPGYGVRSGYLSHFGIAKLEMHQEHRFLTWPVMRSDAHRDPPDGGHIVTTRPADVHGRFMWAVTMESKHVVKDGKLKSDGALSFLLGMPVSWENPQGPAPAELLYHNYSAAVTTYSTGPLEPLDDPELFKATWIR